MYKTAKAKKTTKKEKAALPACTNTVVDHGVEVDMESPAAQLTVTVNAAELSLFEVLRGIFSFPPSQIQALKSIGVTSFDDIFSCDSYPYEVTLRLDIQQVYDTCTFSNNPNLKFGMSV